MIIDRENMMSDAQAITATANSTDVIDLTSNADVARGDPMRFRAQVKVPLDSAGEAATLRVQLVESAAANLGTPTVLLDTGVQTEASVATAGVVMIDAVLPRTRLRYLGVIYTVAGEDFTTGNVDAFLVHDTETARDARPLGVTGY